MMRRPITDPIEIAELNRVLAIGLRLYLDQYKERNANVQTKSQSEGDAIDASGRNEAARRQINAAIDEAERVAGPAAMTGLLQNLIEARRYCAAVNSRSSFLTSSVIAPPPSPGGVERLMEILRGKYSNRGGPSLISRRQLPPARDPFLQGKPCCAALAAFSLLCWGQCEWPSTYPAGFFIYSPLAGQVGLVSGALRHRRTTPKARARATLPRRRVPARSDESRWRASINAQG